ncbi:MAG: immunoglobulin domain-containing protein [Alistipes sp.]|nr:immunoglobulin domain-containing protein [Alistipes sp.]
MLFPLSAVAQGDDAAMLQQLAATMRAYDPYEVSFMMEGEGFALQGRYVVAGDRYRITLPEAEVWGEAAMRYEVDHRRETITLTPIDQQSGNLLDNPTRAFDFAPELYMVERTVTEGDTVRLELVLKADPKTRIHLTLDRAKLLPKGVRYEMDGVGVDVKLTYLRAAEQPLAPFSLQAYSGYEVVDFR